VKVEMSVAAGDILPTMYNPVKDFVDGERLYHAAVNRVIGYEVNWCWERKQLPPWIVFNMHFPLGLSSTCTALRQ
jgi:hypothetical protein